MISALTGRPVISAMRQEDIRDVSQLIDQILLPDFPFAETKWVDIFKAKDCTT